MAIDYESIGKRIKHYRTQKKLSQEELGKAVFATPVMINWMEQTSLKLCQQVLPKGYDTVGTFVNVKHLAATPVGMKVRVIAEIEEVNGKMLTFKVKAYDEKTKIGEGTHGRAIIDVERFISKLKNPDKK